ncbi:TasA family protein, partial [Sporosarcina koreensis]
GGNNGGGNNGGGNNGGGNNGGGNNGGGNNGGGNNGNNNSVIASMTLYELKSMSPNAIKLLTGGILAGGSKDFTVEFEFVDNGENQNELQGASLELKWVFEAKQTAGSSK